MYIKTLQTNQNGNLKNIQITQRKAGKKWRNEKEKGKQK